MCLPGKITFWRGGWERRKKSLRVSLADQSHQQCLTELHFFCGTLWPAGFELYLEQPGALVREVSHFGMSVELRQIKAFVIIIVMNSEVN